MIRSFFRPRPILLCAGWALSLGLAWYLGSRREAERTSEARSQGPSAEQSVTAPWKRGGGAANQASTAGGGTGDGQAAMTPAQRTADFERRLKNLRDLPPSPERNNEWTRLVREMAKSDPEAALAAARSMPELLLRHELKETALRSWAAADPAAAWAYAEKNPEGDLPDERMEMILEGIGNGDPDKALAFLVSHQEKLGSMLGRGATLVDELYENGGNHDRLKTWVESLPAGKLKEATMNRFIDRWARYDPQAALSWMNSRNIPQDQLAAARVELTESWARVDPKAALAWTEGLPAKERDPSYYEAIYRRWLQYDRNGAAGWLAEQPPSPALDRPIENYVRQVAGQNPSDTMPWAESITDPKRRWRAVDQVADIWRKRDLGAFENYVRSSGAISDDQKRRLLRLDEKKTVVR